MLYCAGSYICTLWDDYLIHREVDIMDLSTNISHIIVFVVALLWSVYLLYGRIKGETFTRPKCLLFLLCILEIIVFLKIKVF